MYTLKQVENWLKQYRDSGFGDDALVFALLDEGGPTSKFGDKPLRELHLFSSEDKMKELTTE